MRLRNIIVGLVIVLLIAGAIYMNQKGGGEGEGTAGDVQSTGPIKPDRDVKPQKGFAAPDFQLETLTGEQVRLYENNGKPSVINFWASWCGPCKVEMPDLQKAYEQYGDEVNFHMVNLTINDNFDKMTRYIEENGYTFPILLDETGDVGMDYTVAGIPTTYIVDKKGIIVQHIVGPMSEQQIRSIIDDLTNE